MAPVRPRRTGVGYYTEHLLHHLAADVRGDELTVISNQSVDTDQPLPPHVRVVESGRRFPRMVWMQAVAPRTLQTIGAEVAHFTNGMVPVASPVPTVVTIHDVSLRLYPRYHPPRRVLLNGPLVALAAVMMIAALKTFDWHSVMPSTLRRSMVPGGSRRRISPIRRAARSVTVTVSIASVLARAAIARSRKG